MSDLDERACERCHHHPAVETVTFNAGGPEERTRRLCAGCADTAHALLGWFGQGEARCRLPDPPIAPVAPEVTHDPDW